MTNGVPTNSNAVVKPRSLGSIALGVILVILGITAIVFPFFATLVAESWISLILIAAGLTKLVYAFQTRTEDGLLWKLLLGILYIATGLILWLYPLQGAITLTLVLGSFLLTEGVFEVILALRLRSTQNWVWVMANGIVTLVLGSIIWFQLPTSAAWVIGTLLGISILSSGISRIMLAVSSSSTLPPDSQASDSQPQGSASPGL
ncbi:MAG: HdeD family acid-resistance protein [Leptolyngbyaceae cyanobacterium CRU_2_3]|nr:HdeD family acid-resistance protein [Leptolyngbyaceae cyanobacterium CRU_2_3]